MAEASSKSSTGRGGKEAGVQTIFSSLASMVQVVSIVVGVVVSILSFNATSQREAEVRAIEAAKPFLELRRSTYLEAVEVAGILANPEVHTEQEVNEAKKQFRTLYVTRLSMVETPSVEQGMKNFAAQVDPALTVLNPSQSAAYDLSHALGDTFVSSYGLSQ